MATIETNWKDVPTQFNFTAVDRNGCKFAYVEKPYKLATMWITNEASYVMMGMAFDMRQEEWKESLRERPQVVEQLDALKIR